MRGMRWLWIGAALLVTACDDVPTEPLADDGTAADDLAAATVAWAWDDLPTVWELQDETEAATARTAATRNARERWMEADRLRALAVDVATWDGATAAGLEAQARAAALEGVLRAGGVGVASRLVARVEGVLQRLERRLAGREVGTHLRDRLRDARQDIDGARTRLRAGDGHGAMGAGLDAAVRLRDLAPEHWAQRAIEAAKSLLERATAAAGPNPPEAIADALDRSTAFLEEAVRAYEAGRYRDAVAAARHSMDLSRWVLRQIHDGDGDLMEARARALVGNAQVVLERAIHQAGADPRPEVAQALRDAEAHLVAARDALAQGDWEEAARHALECLALARRVLAWLR